MKVNKLHLKYIKDHNPKLPNRNIASKIYLEQDDLIVLF